MPGCRQVFPVLEGLTQNSLEMWSLVLCLRGTFRKNSEGGFQLSTHITGSQQQTLLSLHGLGFPGVRASCSCGFSSRTDGSSDSPCTRCRLSPADCPLRTPGSFWVGAPSIFQSCMVTVALGGSTGLPLVPHGGPPAHSGPALPTLPSTAGPGRCWEVGSCLWGLPAMLGCGRRPTVCRAPFLHLADGLLPREPQTGHPRHCNHQGEGDIATSPVQRERLVEAPPSLPGGGSDHVPNRGLGYLVSSSPCCTMRGSTSPTLYPFRRAAPACGLGWGRATGVLLRQRGSCACCDTPLCSVLHTESPTGVLSCSPLLTPCTSVVTEPEPSHTCSLCVSLARGPG